MRISVTVVASDVEVESDFISLDLFPEMTLDEVKGFIEAEINVSPSKQHFLINSQPVQNTAQSLSTLGVNEGEVLSLIIRSGPLPANAGRQPPARSRPRPSQSAPPLDAEATRLHLLNDSATLANVRENDPELAHMINDPVRFRELFDIRIQRQKDAVQEKQEMMNLLDSDPFNPDAQTKIEELIRQERVMENMKKALEDNPESFGRVVMLYIDVQVNNMPIKAFVDSGAQTTIMSPDAAERCGIMRLIDHRYGGIARGVGTAKILGRVHSADIQIGPYNLASSFTVMEGKGVDLLLGLDMLKRHQMCIDLRDNCLRIQTDAIPFLSENEAPKEFEAALDDEKTIKGPGGTEIGASSGTVKPPPPAGPSTAQAQPPPARSAPIPQQQASLPAHVTEAAISQVTGLGFSRQQAIMALQQAQGNVELAIGLLFD